MYIAFNAPLGPGGPSEWSVPPLVSDAGGNPLPLKPEVPAAISIPASITAEGAAAPSWPLVLPWIDYGVPLDQPLSGAGPALFSSRVAEWMAQSGVPWSGDPPWSDALVNKPPGCCGASGGVVEWAKQHPLLVVALVIGAVIAVQGFQDR